MTAGQHKEQIADSTRAVQLRPSDPSFYKFRADALAMAGNFEEAIDDCTRAIQLQPNNPERYIDRAKLYQQAKNYSAALADCQRALDMADQNDIVLTGRQTRDGVKFQAWQARGDIFYETREWSRALFEYDKALAVVPNNSYRRMILPQRARVYVRLGRLDAVTAEVEQIRTIAPEIERSLLAAVRYETAKMRFENQTGRILN